MRHDTELTYLTLLIYLIYLTYLTRLSDKGKHQLGQMGQRVSARGFDPTDPKFDPTNRHLNQIGVPR